MVAFGTKGKPSKSPDRTLSQPPRSVGCTCIEEKTTGDDTFKILNVVNTNEINRW
jgi:hypothetical protein